jgi:alkanesulfonate monooxygenase SsuD/methylene tetrahydromethanopterin reductase-like flavin-dependent oxidoreductase (luciferase family)
MWIAARDPDSHDFAVRSGCNVMVTPLMKGDEEVVDLKRKFDTAVANHPEVSRPELMVLRHTHVHSPEEPDGWRPAAEAISRFYRTFDAWFGNKTTPVNGFLDPSPKSKFEGRPEFELESLHRTAMIGTPAHGTLHVFLRRHAARTRVSALSGVRLPECFARIRAADLRDAQRQSACVRAGAGGDGCTVFVDIEVLVESDVRAALHAAEQLGQTSASTGATLCYIGTPHGLAGFIADLHTLGIADGVTLIPLRAADNPQRIINDVLPILGVDAARLSA